MQIIKKLKLNLHIIIPNICRLSFCYADKNMPLTSPPLNFRK